MYFKVSNNYLIFKLNIQLNEQKRWLEHELEEVSGNFDQQDSDLIDKLKNLDQAKNSE